MSIIGRKHKFDKIKNICSTGAVEQGNTHRGESSRRAYTYLVYDVLPLYSGMLIYKVLRIYTYTIYTLTQLEKTKRV